jgi:flagellin FlaB
MGSDHVDTRSSDTDEDTGDWSVATRCRAQSGVAALIVFVALVLVATLAAGVFLDTASLLQSQSTESGKASVDRVSGRLQTYTVLGNVTGEYADRRPKSRPDALANGTFNAVRVTVGLAPGSGPVDLRNVTVYWYGPETATALTFGRAVPRAPERPSGAGLSTSDISPAPGGGGSDDGGHVTFNAYSFDTDRHTVVTEKGQRNAIYLNVALIESETRENRRPEELDPMQPGESATVIVETESGAKSRVEFTVPETLSPGETVRL